MGSDRVTTGGDLLVRALLDRGVDTVFALPGVQLDGLFDGFAAHPELRVVHTRHEQATSYMADGYARATGRVGVCAVVPGPGVLNAGAGLADAYANNSAVLMLAGHLFGGDTSLGTGALHEIPDQSAVIVGTIGETNRVRTVEQLGAALDAAYARLAGWPVRPAAIEIGPEVLLAETDLTLPVPAPLPHPPTAEESIIEQAAAALAEAARPVIMAGGGARLAGEALSALADSMGAPIVLTAEGKGAVPADRPDVLPSVAGFTLLEEADAVVVVGSRFHTAPGLAGLETEAVVVRIDADAVRLGADELPGADSVNIHADATAGAAALAAAVVAIRSVDLERDAVHRARVDEVRTAVLAGMESQFPDTWAYCQVLRDVLADDGILVDEMTQVGYVARNAYPVVRPRTYIGSGYQGTLGFGYATALGAKVGCPDLPVVSISGDGGFLYAASELATAVHHGIAVVAVVFADGAFGNVKGIQQRVYGREIASTLTNPDFVELAGSFGVGGSRVESPEDLGPALTRALDRNEPWLIEVPIGPQPDIWAVLTGRRRL